MLETSGIVVRTPFLPFYPNCLRESFENQLHSAIFKEALFLGSPDLYEEFEKSGEIVTDATKLSLYKYFLRMSYRCTPFGMFSGVSAGTIDSGLHFTLPSQHLYRKHSRPDNHFISTFIHKVLSDQKLKESIKWFSNNTIYHNGISIRYLEYRFSNNQRTHHLAKVDTSVYLNVILEKAKYGACINSLAMSITSNEISIDDAMTFINELIDGRLLLSELEPVVTGQEPYMVLLNNLEKYDEGKRHALFLKQIIENFHAIESQPPGADIIFYKEVLKMVKDWDAGYDPKYIFQFDISKPSSNMKLDRKVLDDLKEAIAFLSLLNDPVNNYNLNKFKEEFTKRYEDSEVPLLEVLDAESGIGYPPGTHANNDQSPLLQGLHINSAIQVPEYRLSGWQKELINEYYKCLAHKKIELIISDDMFSVDKKLFNENVLPDSFFSICSILSSSTEQGKFVIDYRGTSGPSAANLLGRFCYSDNGVLPIVNELIEQEERLWPNKIFAEVVHLAQARVGNVLIRPSLRKYEIPILTFASVDLDHTISLEDLQVSIKNNKVLLRSKRLNKEIVPRNTTAHNYASDTVPYYYFLCDLQLQETSAKVFWDWGMLSEFRFLPRIKYGRVILSRARWLIHLGDFMADSKQLNRDFNTRFGEFKNEYKLPRWVTLSQSDNQLPLDLEDELCLKILKQELVRNRTLTVEECLFDETNLVVEGPEGRFTNEIIVPWVKNKVETNHHVSFNQKFKIQRDFVPGTSWHYVKIYCGVKTSDRIVTEVIKPIADNLMEEGKLSQWFFIRYVENGYHLRIRFKIDQGFSDEVTQKINKELSPYILNNLVWKIQIDTYKRELERYGVMNIEDSEMLFFHDSVAASEVLKLLEGDEGDQVRWQFAIKGVNDLLNDFDLNLGEKERLMILLREEFRKEFHSSDKDSQKRFSEHYRKYRKEIEFILSPEIDEDHDYHVVWEIFRQRSLNWAVPINRIKANTRLHSTDHSLENLLGSYIHMFLNRFMRSKQRVHEMVIYDFLCQYYRSAIARHKKHDHSGLVKSK